MHWSLLKPWMLGYLLATELLALIQNALRLSLTDLGFSLSYKLPMIPDEVDHAERVVVSGSQPLSVA